MVYCIFMFLFQNPNMETEQNKTVLQKKNNNNKKVFLFWN